MKQMIFLSIITFALCYNYKKDKNVLILNEDNFDQALNEFNAILVLFYTPWCGLCKKLAPEYSKAAAILEKENITLAKVDSSVNKNVSKFYEIEKYPTIRLFSNNQTEDYTENNVQKDIVNWMRIKVGPSIRTLESFEQIEKFIEDYLEVIIYLGSNRNDLNIIEKIAKENKHYIFGSCSVPEVYSKYNTTEGSLILFKNFDEKRNDFTPEKLTEEGILSFLSQYYLPIAMYFNGFCAKVIFEQNRPGLFLYRANKAEKTEHYEELIQQVALKLNRTIQVVVSGISEGYQEKLGHYIGITAEDLPSVYIHDTRARIRTYKMKGEITEENILNFVEDWKNDRLIPIWKSEEIPKEQTEIVYKLVGISFESVVLKSTKDVLILFYSYYIENTRQVKSIYSDLATKYQDNSNLLFAEVDSSENEIEMVYLKGIPSIYLWQVKTKELLLYVGELSIEKIEIFLKENSTFPFTIKQIENTTSDIDTPNEDL